MSYTYEAYEHKGEEKAGLGCGALVFAVAFLAVVGLVAWVAVIAPTMGAIGGY